MNGVSEYKNVILYLLRFVGLYLLAVWIYNYFLSFYKNTIDPLTALTARLVYDTYRLLHIPAEVIPAQNEGIKLLIHQKYIARIVEGCNAVSIIILFAAFVLSFWKLNKKTLIFLLAGIMSIFLFNILRITLLGYILYAFPAYQDFWHRIVFPGLIYSWIVFLWVLFINKFL